MSWLAFVPTLLTAGTILFVPGAAVGWAMQLRGLKWAASAAPLSLSLVTVASIGAGAVGVKWTILPVAILTLVASACAWAWMRWVGPKVPATSLRKRRDAALVVVALLFAVVVIALVIASGMHDPQYFSQRYDNFFHLNAVRFILDTGNASPLWIGNLTSPDGTLPFYPSAWHALVSLVVQLSGSSIVVATNATILVVAAVMWPLGCLLLVRSLLGRGVVVTVAGGVLASAFPAFPYLPLHYGVLYPLFLGLAGVPVLLSALWALLRPTKVARRWDSALLVLLLLPGVAGAHPGAFLAALALSLPMVIGALIHRMAKGSGHTRVVSCICILGYLGLGVVVIRIVRPPADQIYWPVIESVPAAIGSVVSSAVYGYPVAWLTAILCIIGAYHAVRRPSYVRWIILTAAMVGGTLYVIVAASPSELLRNWLTGPWYNNAPRLASIFVIGALPLAVLGIDCLVRVLARISWMSVISRNAARFPLGGGVILGILLVLGIQGGALRQAGADIGFTYQMRPDAPIVTPDELALMNRLDKTVPPDAVIADDPYTGASFAYALSGRKVLMPHLLMQVSKQAELINSRFVDEGDSPRMCQALDATGVRYILDFSEHGDFMANDADFSGLRDLSRSPYVTLVDSESGAKLYRITTCGFGS